EREELRDEPYGPAMATRAEFQLADDSESGFGVDRFVGVLGRCRADEPQPQRRGRSAIVLSIRLWGERVEEMAWKLFHPLRQPLFADVRSGFRIEQPDQTTNPQHRFEFHILLARERAMSRVIKKRKRALIETP